MKVEIELSTDEVKAIADRVESLADVTRAGAVTDLQREIFGRLLEACPTVFKTGDVVELAHDDEGQTFTVEGVLADGTRVVIVADNDPNDWSVWAPDELTKLPLHPPTEEAGPS